MKDSEFTELLNLYLDHEISAADAARLEAEVQSNPNRRRVYQDYCRMQKACKMLAQDFAGENTADAEDKIVAFEQATAQRNNRRGNLYLAGAFAAAAACVAIIFVGRSRDHASENLTTAPVAVQTAPANPATNEASPMLAAATVPASHGIERRSVNTLSLRNAQPDALALAVGAQNDPHFAWIQDLRLTPIQTPTPADQLRFDNSPNLTTEIRTYASGNKTIQSDVPMTAIRFQK